MGDTANWEFAAAVAAITIGLGGLLLFTLIAALGAWRLYSSASAAAEEAARASVAVQDMSRQIELRRDEPARAPTADTAGALADLNRRADLLFEQHARMQDAVRGLVEATAQNDGSRREIEQLQSAVRRLEDNMSQIAAAVANLNQGGA